MQRCKRGGREDYRVRRTVSCEDRVKVQMGAELRCKGGKVNDKTGRGVAEAEEITEYRGGRHEVGAWLCRALLG